MSPLTNTALLNALGYAIINSLWHFASLWLLYITLTSFGFSANSKYRIGLIAQLTGFGWFLTDVFVSYNYGTSISFKGEFLALGFKNLSLDQLLPYISIIYLVLLLVTSIRWMQAYKRTLTIKSSSLQKMDIEWRLFIGRMTQLLGVRRKVFIYASQLIKTPLTIGFLKPVILVPLASVNSLTNDEMEAILLHELAHIRRFDYLHNLILAAIESLLYFNPFMHLISRSIKIERENSCDDLVLQFQYSPNTYATALFNIASFHSTSPAFALNAIDDRKMLLRRIQRITGTNRKTQVNYRQSFMALLFLFMAVISLLILVVDSAEGLTKENVRLVKNEEVFFNPMMMPFAKQTETSTSSFNAPNHLLASKGSASNHASLTSSPVASFSSLQGGSLYTSLINNTTSGSGTKYMFAVDKPDNNNASPIEQRLIDDVNLAVEQANTSNRSLDAITLKTIMLARIKQLAEQQKTLQADQKYLQHMEKKMAANIINNIIDNNSGNVVADGDQVIVQYPLPADEKGNSYCFEYIIAPSAKATAAAKPSIEKAEPIKSWKVVGAPSVQLVTDSVRPVRRHLKSAHI